MTKTIGKLSPREFESLIFDLVQSLGLRNTVWRTPGRDGGRDIQGEWFISDLSGHVSSQVWYIECKKYESSVSWPTVWEKISYAESNSADVLLFTVTSSLSPQAVDEVHRWNSHRKRPLIRFWNGHDIQKIIGRFPILEIKYGLIHDSRVKVGAAILPVVDILLKYSIAANSAEIFEVNSSGKRDVLYSISELLSARLKDVQLLGTFSSEQFRNSKDSYEWLKNSEILEEMRIDRYAIRAIACYLKDLSKASSLHIFKESDSTFFKVEKNLSTSILNDLKQIASLSNFDIYQNQNRLTIRVH